MDTQNFLGTNSYPSVVGRLKACIEKSKAQTLAGEELLGGMFKTLNESATPIISLKPFVTKAEKLADEDKTVLDILNIIKKDIHGNADLNFLINVCKEEHFKNVSRTGHPDPSVTVTHIKNDFDKPSSQIEKLIEKGVFDSLESNLLGEIKKDLGYNENQKTKEDKKFSLNESTLLDGTDIVRYSPLGFISSVNGENYGVVENNVFKIVNQPDGNVEMVKSDNSILFDNPKLNNFNQILSRINFNPRTREITTSQKWDFDMVLLPTNQVVIRNKQGEERDIPSDKIKDFFAESLIAYDQNPTLIGEDYIKHREDYVNDADNFINVVNNKDLLMSFNNLEVIKDLQNPAKTFMYDKKLADTKYDVNLADNIFTSMIDINQFKADPSAIIDVTNEIDSQFGKQILGKIFANRINGENNALTFKTSRKNFLLEEQNRLNGELAKIHKLQSMAEENSPSIEKLDLLEKRASTLLDANIAELEELV